MESFMSTHKSVHWNTLEFWGGKGYDDVLKETQQFPGIPSWSVIHNAYQT